MGSLHQEEIDVDLVIVGGGPTGLLTGLLAERLSVTVCILDSKPGPLEIGRADALNARTQQYLEIVGVLDDLLPEGITCNTSSTFANGEFKSRQSHWWTSLSHTYRKNFLMVGQPLVEKVLESRLRSPVLYDETVTAIHEDDLGVTITTNRSHVFRCKHAVGADGARSTVRNAFNISFTGTKPKMLWAVLDTFLDTDFPTCSEIITLELNGQSRVAWIPRERGLARFYVLLDGEITQQKAENAIREHMAPYRVEFTRTEWFSTFEVKERIASTFVSQSGKGRVILAGDAAHVHSVNGGQGLNTGIADAFGLAWRLASVITGNLTDVAAQKLISSYDIERRTVAQGVISVAATLVRDTVREAKKYVSTIQRHSGYITGMGISYDGIDSPLIVESTIGIWTAGHRCPDIYLQRISERSAKRLYSLLSYGKHLVLMIGAMNLDYHSNGTDYGDLTRFFTVVPYKATFEITEMECSNTEIFFADWIRGGDSYVVVVRPDMYIGFVGEGDGWKEYLFHLSKCQNDRGITHGSTQGLGVAACHESP